PLGVRRISAQAFEPVNNQLLQVSGFRAHGKKLFRNQILLALSHHAFDGVRGLERRRTGQRSGAGESALIQGLRLVAYYGGAVDETGKPDGIEVDIGSGGKEAVDHKRIDGRIGRPGLTRTMRI